MEQEVDKSKILYSIFHNDSQISFEVTDEVLLIANFLGNHPQILRSIYKAYRKLNSEFTYKPKIGATIHVEFDYGKERSVTFSRQQIKLRFLEADFLIFMAKIDAIYTEILPVGSIVELDEEMLPAAIKNQLEYSGVSELVVITGRKLPLQAPFDKYIVDYYAYVWPIGQLPATRPMFISNMMIKRVVHQGLSHPLDETFSLDVLRATQLAKEQISTAYMPSKDGLAYYKHYAKDLFGIDLLEKEVK